MIEIVNCPVCNSTHIKKYLTTKDYFFTQESFGLSQCTNCTFIFTNPVPAMEDIGRYYETDKYLSHNSSQKGIISYIYNKVRDINLGNKYKILKAFKTKGSILDIGCGTGELLNYLQKKSWTTKGVEPNENARLIAEKDFGLDIMSEIDLNNYYDSKFDIISMWHVLEHVYDLNSRLKRVHELLKDDGIAVIAIPMIDSPDALKFKKYWAGLDVPRHLHHFSSYTLELLANSNMFNVVEKFPMKFDSLYVSWLSHQAKGSSLAFAKGVIDGLVSNVKANSKTNYSSMIFVLNKKNN